MMMMMRYIVEGDDELHVAYHNCVDDRAVISGLENGTLKPVLSKEFALNDVIAAHVEVIEHVGGSAGKITLNPWA